MPTPRGTGADCEREPGKRRTSTNRSTFRDALDRLLASAALQPTAIMCAETLWWRCHRRLIADAAVMRGAEVVHLLDVGKRQVHEAVVQAKFWQRAVQIGHAG